MATQGQQAGGVAFRSSVVLKERSSTSRFCFKNDVAIFLFHGDLRGALAFGRIHFRSPQDSLSDSRSLKGWNRYMNERATPLQTGCGVYYFLERVNWAAFGLRSKLLCCCVSQEDMVRHGFIEWWLSYGGSNSTRLFQTTRQWHLREAAGNGCWASSLWSQEDSFLGSCDLCTGMVFTLPSDSVSSFIK